MKHGWIGANKKNRIANIAMPCHEWFQEKKNKKMCDEQYYNIQKLRVEKLFSKKHACFDNAAGLANWYVGQLKKYNCKCYYCETSIQEINFLIDKGLVKERRIGYGFRGRVLEIDKNDDSYILENCVLACYYCNNDKSYTMNVNAG